MHPREVRGHFVCHQLCARLGARPEDFPSVRVESILAVLGLNDGRSRLYLENQAQVEAPLSPGEVVDILAVVEDARFYERPMGDKVALNLWARFGAVAAVVDQVTVVLRDGRTLSLQDGTP